MRSIRPRVIYPGIGQELAPGQLLPGCCGVVGPDPSATRDKPAQRADIRTIRNIARSCQIVMEVLGRYDRYE